MEYGILWREKKANCPDQMSLGVPGFLGSLLRYKTTKAGFDCPDKTAILKNNNFSWKNVTHVRIGKKGEGLPGSAHPGN
jgi:hypothetical protein